MGNLKTGAKQVPRDARGRFAKGASGNAGGRPKIAEDLRTAFRERCPEALETLLSVMRSEKAADRDRIRAAEIILDRGYGKPVQAVSMEPNEDGEALGVVVLAPVMEPTKPPEELPDA